MVKSFIAWKSTVDEYKCEILDANQKLAIPYAIDKLDVATVPGKYKEFFNAQKKKPCNRNLDGIMFIQNVAFNSSNAFLIRHKHLKDIIEKMRGPILQTWSRFKIIFINTNNFIPKV